MVFGKGFRSERDGKEEYFYKLGDIRSKGEGEPADGEASKS